MKRLFTILLTLTVFFSLHAQETNGNNNDANSFKFARQYFEMGIGTGFGFANDFLGAHDVFNKNIQIDLNTISNNIGEDGVNLETYLFAEFYIKFKKIEIGEGLWELGVFYQADGNIGSNLPKNLLSLVTEGNKNNSNVSGKISSTGGIFAEIGIGVAAQFGKLRLGVKPAFYVPLVFIPKSGINYVFDTTDGVLVSANGQIDIYSPFAKNGEVKPGSDITLEGSYAFFDFLEAGGSISRIPIFAPSLNNRMSITLSDLHWKMTGQQLIDGEEVKIPEFEFKEYYDTAEVKAYRPLRIDLFASLKPFRKETFTLRPNAGFTFDINNKDVFINAGLTAMLNAKNFFIFSIGTNREEGIRKQHLGFAFNLRAFELNCEASLQSQNFIKSFELRGFGFDIGIRFGW